MATYVLGDLQGCYATLEALLARIAWDPARDEVWLVGDVVNRGAGSLEALRWARAHAARCVLGNHDLHLLGVAAGVREQRPGDTLDAVLAAPDREELIDWLRARPPLERDGGRLLVHAGLLPEWSLARAEELAAAAGRELAGPGWREFLARYYRRKERERDPVLAGLWAMTMIRVLDAEGRPTRELSDYKGPPAGRPPGSEPWFAWAPAAWPGVRVLFGHWAALGLHTQEGATGLDTGCVWGGALTAYRLEDGAVFQEPSRG
ncbi:MAG: symmetrical bis(5'-nucleosyl)-tetraphosphatase [Planctomycetota bacterium]